MHQRHRRQTDRRQTNRQTTDGRPIAYSKRNVIRWRLLKIGNLLPVCLRNKNLRNNQITQRRAKFGENRLRIADEMVRQPIWGHTHTHTHTHTDRNQTDCLSNAFSNHFGCYLCVCVCVCVCLSVCLQDLNHSKNKYQLETVSIAEPLQNRQLARETPNAVNTRKEREWEEELKARREQESN